MSIRDFSRKSAEELAYEAVEISRSVEFRGDSRIAELAEIVAQLAYKVSAIRMADDA